MPSIYLMASVTLAIPSDTQQELARQAALWKSESEVRKAYTWIRPPYYQITIAVAHLYITHPCSQAWINHRVIRTEKKIAKAVRKVIQDVEPIVISASRVGIFPKSLRELLGMPTAHSDEVHQGIPWVISAPIEESPKLINFVERVKKIRIVPWFDLSLTLNHTRIVLADWRIHRGRRIALQDWVTRPDRPIEI